MIIPCRRAPRTPFPSWLSAITRTARSGRPTCLRTARWQSSAPLAKPQVPDKKRYVFPQRLLVFHSGTGRTVFIGCTKVSTIILFGFFCSVVAPTYYVPPEENIWMASAVVAAGVIPMLYVAITTKPFVSYVHLVLPDAARVSREALTRWLRMSGRDMTLDFTTMRAIGFSRTSRVPFGELKRKKETVTDISNLVRMSAGASRSLPVRSLFGIPRRFHVNPTMNHSKEPKIWKVLLERIPEISAKRSK